MNKSHSILYLSLSYGILTLCFTVIREHGHGPTSESENEARSDHFHGRTTTGPTSQLQSRFEPGWSGFRKNSPDYWTEQASDSSLVSEFQSKTEEISK